jgi:hypothetical protein
VSECDEIPEGWTECPYCGELVKLPEIYCCEEHAEGRPA